MKISDLKPGMVVALRADSWSPNREPTPYVVMSTEHVLRHPRWRSEADRPKVVLSVTRDDDGGSLSVKSNAVFQRGKDERKDSVLLFGPKNDLGPSDTSERSGLVEVYARNVDGPFEQVKAQREQDREAAARQAEINSLAAKKRKRDQEALVERMTKVAGRPLRASPGLSGEWRIADADLRVLVALAESALAQPEGRKPWTGADA